MLKVVRSNSKQEDGLFGEDESPSLTRLPLDYISYNLEEGVVNDVLELYLCVIWVTSII